jgi:hypothetical protein
MWSIVATSRHGYLGWFRGWEGWFSIGSRRGLGRSSPALQTVVGTLALHWRDCPFEYARDCPNDVCVAGVIGNYTSQLMTIMESSSSYSYSTNHNNIRQRRRAANDDDNARLVKEALMLLTQWVYIMELYRILTDVCQVKSLNPLVLVLSETSLF